MPIMNVDVGELSGIDPGTANLSKARIDFSPYAPYANDDEWVSRNILRVSAPEGVATTFVPATPTGNAYEVQERGFRGARHGYVLVPDQPTVEYVDLVWVDKDTLDPLLPPSPAWVAALAAEVEARSTGDTTNANNLTAHLNDTVDAHAASAISFVPGGGVAATDVQAAILELASDEGGFVPTSRTVAGHPLSANVVVTPDDLDDTATSHKFVTAAEKTKLSNTSGTNSGDQDLSGLQPIATLAADTAPHVSDGSALDVAVAAKIAQADNYAIQRLDRSNTSRARKGGGVAAVAYADTTEVSESYADLTGVTAATNAAVTSNRLRAVDASQPAGIVKSFAVAVGEVAHVSQLIYWKAGGSSAPVYVGIDCGTVGHAPVTSSPESLLIGLNGAGVPAIFRGGNLSAVAYTETRSVANPSTDTTYVVTVDITTAFVSMTMRKLGSSTDLLMLKSSRSDFVAASKSINNIVNYIVDSRGASGHTLSPFAGVRSRQPTRSKTLGGQTFEGVQHRLVQTGPSASGDPWNYSLPASYDPRVPSPVVLVHHQATASQWLPWTDTRMQVMTEALNAAGYIVAAPYDQGDRWGNQASIDNYRALYEFLRDTFSTGPLFLVGASMGFLSILNALDHRALPTPAAVAGIGGVADLDVMYANATYTAAIRTAYGVAGDGSDYDAKTSGWNPIDRGGREFRGVPFRFYTSTGDTVVPKASNSEALAAKVLPFGPEASVVLGSGGHLDASQFQAADLLAFFETYR